MIIYIYALRNINHIKQIKLLISTNALTTDYYLKTIKMKLPK